MASIGRTAPFIVMDVDILLSGIPSNSSWSQTAQHSLLQRKQNTSPAITQANIQWPWPRFIPLPRCIIPHSDVTLHYIITLH